MIESTKRPYLGGEETGFPEIERSITNKDVTNAIANFAPQYSEFYGATPGEADPAVRKWLQQSEFKKPYGRPNEEIPDYPSMEWNFAPPTVSPPGFPPIEPPSVPARPCGVIVFDLEINDTICPGVWTTIELFSTEPIYDVQLISPNPGEQIKPLGKGVNKWRKAQAYVPESSAGGLLNVQAYMRSVEGCTGFSNDAVDIEALESVKCPRIFMEIQVDMDFSAGANYTKTIVWDFWKELVPTDIVESKGGATVTFPCDLADLAYWESLLEVVPVNNWLRGRKYTQTLTNPLINPLTQCIAPGDSVADVELNAENGAQFQGCEYTCDVVQEQDCEPGPVPPAQDGLRHVNFDETHGLAYTATIGSGTFNYGGQATTGDFTDFFKRYGSRTAYLDEPSSACGTGTYRDITWDIEVSYDHHGTIFFADSLDVGPSTDVDYLNWPWGGDFRTLTTIVPFLSNWNYGKDAPEKPDFSIDLLIAIYEYKDANATDWTHVCHVYGGTDYANTGANYGSTTGITILGARKTALETAIEDLINDGFATISGSTVLAALNLTIQFYYGKY